MKQSQGNYKRIVVKIGSSLFYKNGRIDALRLYDIVSNIGSLLLNEKKEVIIVSSGAIALGMSAIKLKSRPKELSVLQAVAAIGQNALMDNYSNAFVKYGITCAQVLLTWEDFDGRRRYLNAKNTLLKLLELGAIPVINENDTISTDEIRFGDNDRLSALVASLISADLLIILSDVPGLLDRNKNLVKFVDEITPQIRALACPTDKQGCVGGMVTKIEAARMAVGSGIPCVIAKGDEAGIISRIAIKPDAGGNWTLFRPGKGQTARKHWIAFGTKPKGKISVDEGAKNALLNKKSLLSVGITHCEGGFESGDIVSVFDQDGHELARGKAAFSCKQLSKFKGSRIDKEVIHRDNIAIL